jgi:RNA polymerase sigma factor (sigma-70 family)
LLRVITHLSGFRGEAKFETWVYRVATNHLLTARSRRAEMPAVSFDALEKKLAQGMTFAHDNGLIDAAQSIAPEDKLAAQRVALGCTQGMLMCVDREHRLAYILDIVFGLESREAAQILAISDAAYRKRLSRARERLQAFMQENCSLVADNADCNCSVQVSVRRAQGAQGAQAKPVALTQYAKTEMLALTQMSDAAAVFRAHPQYQVPAVMLATIRAVLKEHERRWQ